MSQNTALATGMKWRNRVQDLLLSDAGPVAVFADRGSGIDFIIAALGSAERPLVWFRLDEHDEDDSASQANKLADAMARGVGKAIFGYGLPLASAVSTVLRVHSVLGPFIVVASGAEYLGSGADELLRLSPAGSLLILVYSGNTVGVLPNGVASSVGMRELALTFDEAAQVAADRLSEDEMRQMLVSTNYKFLPFLQALNDKRGSVPILVPDPDGASVLGSEADALNAEVLVDALHQRGRASEALELGLRCGVALSEDLVDAAGWEHDSRGLHERLWRLLSALPLGQRQRNPSLMRWYFAMATTANKHNEVKAEVSRYLQQNSAPELRALFAAAFPGPDFLEETTNALDQLVSPTTLRIHAFALALAGSGDDSVRYLQKALRLSEALGQNSLVVACATDLADYWIKRGSYSDGAEWARWALDWYYASGLKDELRRSVAAALLVYSRILVGDIGALETVVDELDIGFAGIPTSEAVISTRADWAYVNGDISDAERLYALNIASSSTGQFHRLAIDHVQALVALGRMRQAEDVARRSHILTRHREPLARALGKLALGLATATADADASVQHLREAQRVLSGETEAPRLAQASISLAALHHRRGNDEDVRDALAAGSDALRELGFTGWTMLGGFTPEVKTLYQVFNGQSVELELHFMDGERIVFRGASIELGLRQCECLVVMASRPEGVTAERLGIEVYGESAQLSTLKAIVSRLRQVVPVENRPYRVGVTLWSDFLEIERLLATGRVREAMSLYRGPLLPRSQAPAVVELREQLDESLRRAALNSGDVEVLLQLAKMSESDLELYEAASGKMASNDPRTPIIRARLEQVRRDWEQP